MKITSSMEAPSLVARSQTTPGDGGDFEGVMNHLRRPGDETGRRSERADPAEPAPFAFTQDGPVAGAAPFALGATPDGHGDLRKDAAERAFALNELGLFGPRWAQDAATPQDAAGALAREGTGRPQSMGQAPVEQTALAAVAPKAAGAGPSQLQVSAAAAAWGGATAQQHSGVLAAAPSPPAIMSLKPSAAAPPDAPQRAALPALTERTAPEPDRPSPVSLMLHEQDGDIRLIAAADGIGAQTAPLLRRLETLLAGLGKRLSGLTLNGRPVPVGASQSQGAEDGRRPS